MSNDEKNVHTEHCCVHHGCKYGDADCPVESGAQKQSFPCETCDYMLNDSELGLFLRRNARISVERDVDGNVIGKSVHLLFLGDDLDQFIRYFPIGVQNAVQ